MKRLLQTLTISLPSPGEQGLIVELNASRMSHRFNEREGFLLLGVRDCCPEAVLAARYNARFSAGISLTEIRDFVNKLDDLGLLEDENANSGSSTESRTPLAAPESVDAASVVASVEELQAAADKHQRHYPNHWQLFDPTQLFDGIAKSLRFIRYSAPLLPLVFIFALIGLLHNWTALQSDLRVISINTTFFEHIIFSLLTTSLASQSLRGVVARHFGLDTPSFGLTLILGLLPRFNVRIDTPSGTARHACLWLAAAPLVTRLLLFSLGVGLWLVMRAQGHSLHFFGLALALLSMISFLFVANPLMGSAGYQWLSAYFDNPDLRENAFRALRYRLRPPPDVVSRYVEDSLALRVYALASILFMVGLLTFVTLSFATWLELYYGGLGVVVSSMLAVYLAWRLHRRFQPVRRSHQARVFGHRGNTGEGRTSSRSVGKERHVDSNTRSNVWKFPRAWRRILFAGVAIGLLLLPYHYEPGGEARVVPMSAQQIYAQYPGIVEHVRFEGGERVKANTIIATMSNIKQQQDVDETEAQIAQKEADLRVLLTTPTPEQVVLAEESLRTAEVNLKYATKEFERLSAILEKNAIAYATYEQAEGNMERARQQVREQRASLDALRKQVNPAQIEALRAELDGLRKNLDYYRNVLDRTVLRMPFDGTITTMYLGNLENKYLDEGNLFAEVQDQGHVQVEIDIPQFDIGFVAVGDRMRLKLLSFPDRELSGRVTKIFPTSSEISYGTVITVIGLLDNPGGLFKPGMTGYAKLGGAQMMTVQAFTRALVRFIQVEVWSWLP